MFKNELFDVNDARCLEGCAGITPQPVLILNSQWKEDSKKLGHTPESILRACEREGIRIVYEECPKWIDITKQMPPFGTHIVVRKINKQTLTCTWLIMPNVKLSTQHPDDISEWMPLPT